MLMQILEDVLPFLGGLGVLLVGFASGLSVLLNGNGGDFGEPHLAFVSVLNYGLFSEFGKAAGRKGRPPWWRTAPLLPPCTI